MPGVNTSYVFGDDIVSGWRHRYFYTFYSQYGDRKGSAAAEVAILALTFIISLILNISIACAVLRYKEMRTVTNCFLLNLAAADLVFALGIPVVAITRLTQDWILGDVVCRILPYSQFVCGFVLLWTLTLISMDRHRCIVVPPYRSKLTPHLAAGLTIGTWLLAAVLFLPVAFWFHQQRAGPYTVCTLVFPRHETVNMSLCFTIPVLIFACILPMALLVFHYHKIFLKLLATKKRWSIEPQRRTSSLSVIMTPWSRKVSACSDATPPQPTPHEESRLAKHVRVVRVLLLNVVAVLLMWLPITVIMFLIYIDGSRPNEDENFFLRSSHFIWALLIALLNTIVNPLLYGVLSENFRSCFAKLWFGSSRKRKMNRFYADGCGGNASKSNRKSRESRENASSGVGQTPSSGRWNEGFSASPGRLSGSPME